MISELSAENSPTLHLWGRKRVRKALYMATLSATRWNACLHEIYVKLLAKGKREMVAIIVCARKLLIRFD